MKRYLFSSSKVAVFPPLRRNDHGADFLAERRFSRVKQPVQKGNEGAVRGREIYGTADHYAVGRIHFFYRLVHAVVKHAFVQF